MAGGRTRREDPADAGQIAARIRVVTFLVWTLVACVLAVAFWIAHLVRDINERFDQVEHKLDVIIDQLESGQSSEEASSISTTT